MTAKSRPVGHTPDWNITWEKRDKTWPGLFQLDETGPLLYGMDGEEGIYTNDESVFRLIAAAPEMLKALEYALEYFKANDDGDDHSETYILPRLKTVESAIRKARGE